MTTSEIPLYLTITEADAEAESLEELTQPLAARPARVGCRSVVRPSGEAVLEGAKGDAFTLGALALVAVPAFLPKLVEFLQAWALRGENRTVKIKTPAG